MRRAYFTALVTLAWLCCQSQALPLEVDNYEALTGWATRLDVFPPVKHAKSARPAEIPPLTGWATRLEISEVSTSAARPAEGPIMGGMALQDESESALFVAKYTFYTAWKWLLQLTTGANQAAPHSEAAWKDSTPRFVAYGDRYVQNNSLGLPDPQRLKGFTYYNLAFWTSKNGAEDNVGEWIKGSEAQRKAIVQSYNDAGIRLGMSVFGATDKPQTQGNDPIKLAKQIAAFVIKYNLQGVDVDYEEYDLFRKQTATAWLIPLTRQLRVELPSSDGFYLSHAPVAPLFNRDVYPLGYTWIEQRIGSSIDFYNIQYYNQGAYKTCQTLVVKADGFAPKTSLLEMTSVWGIPMAKVVAGKPARKTDADGGDGYMAPNTFAHCIKQASQAGWNAGAMWWEYRGDLQFVLAPVRDLLLP